MIDDLLSSIDFGEPLEFEEIEFEPMEFELEEIEIEPLEFEIEDLGIEPMEFEPMEFDSIPTATPTPMLAGSKEKNQKKDSKACAHVNN